MREPVLLLNNNYAVVYANDAFCRVFQMELVHIIGMSVYQLNNNEWSSVELRQLLEYILPQQKIYENFHLRYLFSNLGERMLIINAKMIESMEYTQNVFIQKLYVLAIEDITEMMKIAELIAALENEQRIRIVDRIERVESILIEIKNEISKQKHKINKQII